MVAKSATRIIGILSIFATSACGVLGESDDNLWTRSARAEGVNDVAAGTTTFGRWAVTRADVPPHGGTLSIEFALAFVEPASTSVRLELALQSDQQSSEWTAVTVPVFVRFNIASGTARAAISVIESTCESCLDHLELVLVSGDLSTEPALTINWQASLDLHSTEENVPTPDSAVVDVAWSTE